jgi:photosystem II stability/assembly factor-like uncharacterized protein
VDIDPGVGRRRRAAALIALAAISIAGAGLAFLYSAQSSKPKPAAASDNPLLVTRDFVTYSFTSPTEGWAMDMASGTAFTASRLNIFRTVDRGRRWEKQLSLSDAFFGYGALSLQAVDSAHCFMLLRGPNELLFRTADRGAHWDQLPVPNPNVEVVAFTDKDYGWLLTSRSDLYVTHDAGSSWQPLPAPPADAFQLRLRRPSEAWMTGFDSGPPHVYTSNDVGQSWQRHDLPSPPGGPWDPGSYFQPTVELLPQVGVVASVVPQDAPPAIATSFDSGHTWRQVLLPGGTVAYQDSSHWWAMGGKGLFKSSDAGQTWTQITGALPDWLYRPQLYILDGKHAWVSMSVPASLSSPGGSGLAFTEDGGLHWTRTQVPHES